MSRGSGHTQRIVIDPRQGSEDTGAEVPRWGLSAPESFVLLNGSSATGSEAFKLGLMELVATGALILESSEHRVLFMERHVATLRDGPRAGAARPRALDAIFDLYARTPHQAVVDGVPALAITELARAAVSEHGSLGRYVSQSSAALACRTWAVSSATCENSPDLPHNSLSDHVGWAGGPS